MPGARGVGAAHLGVLARAPRPAGGAAERAARDYAAGVLRRAGFDVHEESFQYSGFPGRFATPVGGTLATATVLGTAWLGLNRSAPGAAFALAGGVAATALFARSMLGEAVLELPWLGATATNLVATRGGPSPRVWLVAHLDSKSQPVPSLGRVAGISLLALGLLLAVLATALQLSGAGARTAWWAAIGVTVLGAPAVMASVVGARSDGAVDNASGVAAVLAAAESIPRGLSVGVLLPSAEELGLAGARAWARGRPAGVALNCDGVDDDGELTIMHSGTMPRSLMRAVRSAADTPLRERRMPLGLLTDSVALADRGWAAVTVSRGSFSTLRRVHTPADSLANLRGDGIDAAAALLSRAAEALA